MIAASEVQSPNITQSYNLYNYVWNNLMKYVDPTGYYSRCYWDRLGSTSDGEGFWRRGEYVTMAAMELTHLPWDLEIHNMYIRMDYYAD